jgi:S1-C subfamily serine protease
VAARNNNAGVAKSFGLRTSEGVLVSATVADSPAEAAGLRPGDVITEINGSPIRSTNDLQGAIARVGPSADLSIQGWRGSERLSLSATTTERTPAGN